MEDDVQSNQVTTRSMTLIARSASEISITDQRTIHLNWVSAAKGRAAPGCPMHDACSSTAMFATGCWRIRVLTSSSGRKLRQFTITTNRHRPTLQSLLPVKYGHNWHPVRGNLCSL